MVTNRVCLNCGKEIPDRPLEDALAAENAKLRKALEDVDRHLYCNMTEDAVNYLAKIIKEALK